MRSAGDGTPANIVTPKQLDDADILQATSAARHRTVVTLPVQHRLRECDKLSQRGNEEHNRYARG